MKKNSPIKNLLIFIVIIILSLNNLFAQDSTSTKNKWQFLCEPYLMFPNLNGTLAVGKSPDVSIDESPGDIFSHMQIGAMIYLEAHNKKWTVASDLIYVDLNQGISGDTSKLINSGDADLKDLIWELGALYKVAPWFEIGVGTRMYSIKSTLEINYRDGINKDTTKSDEIKQTWVDPILIFRWEL